jgi:hypothetical protein
MARAHSRPVGVGVTDALTKADVDEVIAYMRENQIKPHPDGCYHVTLPKGHERAAFDAGLAPFCPLYMPDAVAIGGLTLLVDSPKADFEGYWEQRDHDRRKAKVRKK